MAPAITDLQADALDRDVPLTDLVRRSYVIARKLGLDEFQSWLSDELNGYTRPQSELPPYRMVSGIVRMWNPYHGWQPVIFESPEEAEATSKRGVGQSVAELEDLLRGGREGQLHIPLPQAIQRRMSASVGFETDFSLFVSRQALVRILDAVRNSILQWALKLEEQGILGDGLSFSQKEKEAAAHTVQNVTNFFGEVREASVIQPGRDAVTVTVNLDLAGVEATVATIRESLADLHLDADRQSELSAELATIEAQLASPKPKRNIVRASLASVRTILEGAGGTVAGQLALELGKLLVGG